MIVLDKTVSNVRIGIWKMDETTETMLSMSAYPDSVRTDASEGVSAASRLRERVAVRLLLETMTGIEPRIGYLASGKPYIVNSNLHISISHTKGYAVVALSECFEVGVDIEMINKKVLNIRHRIVGADEVADSVESVLLHWSAKETAFKILDMESIDFISNLKVYPFDIQSDNAFVLEENKTKNKQTFNINFCVSDDYVLTWCINDGKNCLTNN